MTLSCRHAEGIVMSGPRRLPHRSDLVISTHDLPRRAGESRSLHTTLPAPDGIGIDVIAVPPASPIRLDLTLESVSEGVLVSGTAEVSLVGECARCLDEVTDTLVVDVQDLFVYPESEATEEEAGRIVDERIDLEPLLRDAVVLELPLAPLCRDDCAGLCPVCGANLNDDPDHRHDEALDARWAALQQWADGEHDAEPKS